MKRIVKKPLRTSTIWPPQYRSIAREPWLRSADWLELPDVTGLAKFAGLFAVRENSNFVALSAEGNYTVDWGDGSATEDIATGVVAEHEYDFATVDAGTLTSKGFKQVIVTIVPNGGLLTSVNLTEKHSKVGLQAYTPAFLDVVFAGTDLTFIGLSGQPATNTLYLHQLEQAKIIGSNSITDMSYVFYGLEGLRSIDVDIPAATTVAYMCRFCGQLDYATVRNSGNVQSVLYTFAECGFRYGPTMDTSGVLDFNEMFRSAALLEEVPLYDMSSATSTQWMFENCINLRKIPKFDTSLVTNFQGMFYGCYTLNDFPELDTSSGIDFSYLFSYCGGLVHIPMLDTSSGTDFSYFAEDCYALTSISPIDTSKGENMSHMFAACWLLRSVPKFDMSSCTSTNSMFLNCECLKKVGFSNMPNNLDAYRMFYTCTSLEKVPALNLPLCTNLMDMFRSCAQLRIVEGLTLGVCDTLTSTFHTCSSLESVPLFDTSSVTTFANTFYNCYALKEVPAFDMSSATSISSMFLNCKSLTELPALNCPLVTSTGSAFSGCASLSKVRLDNVGVSVSVTGCNLSAAALDYFYAGLKDGVAGPSVTVTNNHGNDADDPTIATLKGWAVTG